MKNQTNIVDKLLSSAEHHEKEAERLDAYAASAREQVAENERLAASARAMAAEFRRVAALA